MPVVKLIRGDQEWLVQVGDITTEPITDEEAREHALRQANGDGKDFLPADDGDPWEVEGTYPDEQFHEMYGVAHEQINAIPIEPDERLET
jgi:hypothetical protein